MRVLRTRLAGRAMLAATCCLLTALTSPARADAPITHLGLVAPNVIGITFRCGRVEYGRQVAYAPRPGDHVDPGKDRWVIRDGKCIGALVGRDRKILYTMDRLVGPLFEPEWGRKGAYRVQIGGAPIEVTALHRKSKPSDLARTGPWEWNAPTEDTVYLRLDRPVRPGDTVAVTCRGSRAWSRTFRLDVGRARSEAVHVSQIGFRPGDPAKAAYLSCWLGDGGALTYDPVPAFRVVDAATGKTVLTGRARLRKPASEKDEDAYKNNHSKTDVYQMDFSTLRKPGAYRVAVDGVGCSYTFVVGDDVWRKAFAVSAKGFYHQRSGIALGPPYTTYRRPRAFHPADGVQVFASTTGLMDTGNGLGREPTNFGNLVKGATTTPVANAWGGYMDAGDWDRRIQHLDATRLLIELAERFPATFDRLNLKIPESGNGLPDILNEALFNLDCYRRMQTAEGGIRGGIESEEHPRYGEESRQESLRIFAYAPCVWSSYLYAGTAARAARVLDRYRSARAPGAYATSALRAMTWAEAELPGRVGKNDPHAVKDARNLAAAELYRLNGDASWHKLFLQTTVFSQPGQDLAVWEHHDQSEAAWVYATTKRPGVDAAVQANCRAAILKEADARIAQSVKTGFAYAHLPYRPFIWGAVTAPDGVTLARAHMLTRDPKYLKALVLACQPGLGANPSNLCYTTGLGARSIEHPLHLDSRITHQPPPPGLTIGGPRDMQLDRNGWEFKVIGPACYPAPIEWPSAEAYFDVFWYPSMCEFTIHSPMAQNAYVWGYLAARK